MREHAKRVGEIVVNLQSFEFLLRRFLFGVRHEQAERRYENLAVGDVVNENSITNYHGLGRLIKDYNTYVSKSNPGLKLPRNDLVNLRDALAHGRIYSATPDGDCVLLKFSKPVGGRTKAVYSERIGEAWYQTNGQLTFQALASVLKAGKLMNVPGFDVARISP